MADGQRFDLRCQSHPVSCFEAFVKTFKRDYIRINPLPDALTALSRILQL
jgi:hypothetical protein